MTRTFIPQAGANAKVAPHNLYDFRHLIPTAGNIYFVDSVNGSATATGLSPGSALSTLDAAINLCTASNGDVIYLMPGHAETVATAAAIDIDVAGIHIKSLGEGDLRGTFTGSAAASTIEINADDVTLEGLVFTGSFTGGVTAFVDVKTGADDLVFKGCEWREAANTTELLKAVTIEATINRVTFDSCRFKGVIGGDSVAAIFTEGAIVDLRVLNCTFNGDWSGAAVDADAAAITTPEFIGNVVRNADPSAGLAVSLNSATIGTFVNERYLTQKANTVPVSDSSASFFVDCIGTDVANTSGIDLPASATAWA